MSSKTFVQFQTPIDADWLNDVNGATYNGSAVYTPAGVGAVVTDVQTTIQDGVVSVFGFMTSAQKADVRSGLGSVDTSSAFAKARTYAAARGLKVWAPAGRYKLNQVLDSTEDFVLEGDGDGTILDFTGTVTGGSYGISATGSATLIQTLGATATVGTNTVTFSSAPSLVAGDVFVIYNPTDSSWSGFRTYYRAGEWCEVVSVVGNVVTVKNQLYDTYLTTDVVVYKITGPRFSLSNFLIKGTTLSGLINGSLLLNPLIENVSATHSKDSVINWDRCFRPTVNNPNISNVGTVLDDYGIAVGNSQHSRINGGYVFSRRHAVTHGGNASICCVPVRDSLVDGTVLKNTPSSGIFAADFHGNTELSRYVNCTIYGGATLQGKDNEYVNCTITADVSGRVMYHSEIKGGRLGARGCKFITYVDPQPGTRGVYDIGGNNDAITANTTLPVTFYANDCSVYGRNLTSLTSLINFRNAGASVKVNFDFDGLAGDLNAINCVLRTSLSSGTADSDFIIVDRVKNFPSGTVLHVAAGSSYLNFPHRCQKQTGSQSLTATSGTAVTVDSTRNFKYAYPRTPSVQATSVGGYVGNRMAFAGFSALTETNYRLLIESGDATNWTSTLARVVNWTASIDEV